MARVIVTGGARFVGSHVADAFLGRGDDVVVVDDLSTGREDNVPAGARLERIAIVHEAALERDYVYAEDVANAFVAAAAAGRPGTYNIGTGRETSTVHLLEACSELRALRSSRCTPSSRRASALDARLVGRELGWHATVELEDGLRRTLGWYRR